MTITTRSSEAADPEEAMRRDAILVVGSINLDILLFQDRLPALGETYTAREVREGFGGKGANQAVQCAKLGQHVVFIGAIGPDSRGRECRTNLEQQGVDCHLNEVDLPTGIGVNNVLGQGELHATIVRGANAEVTPIWVRHNAELFGRASFVVIQNEIPAETNAEVIRMAHEAGVRVVYNAAPAYPETTKLLRGSDYLIVNEEEAKAYLGGSWTGSEDPRELVIGLTMFCSRVIVTLGGAGSLVSIDGEVHQVPATPVTPVDTTGAGDAFVGAFASALNAGVAELDAAKMASAVAAQATMGVGAQTAMVNDWRVTHDPVRA
jgi:ribokinase